MSNLWIYYEDIIITVKKTEGKNKFIIFQFKIFQYTHQ